VELVEAVSEGIAAIRLPTIKRRLFASYRESPYVPVEILGIVIDQRPFNTEFNGLVKTV